MSRDNPSNNNSTHPRHEIFAHITPLLFWKRRERAKNVSLSLFRTREASERSSDPRKKRTSERLGKLDKKAVPSTKDSQSKPLHSPEHIELEAEEVLFLPLKRKHPQREIQDTHFISKVKNRLCCFSQVRQSLMSAI